MVLNNNYSEVLLIAKDRFTPILNDIVDSFIQMGQDNSFNESVYSKKMLLMATYLDYLNKNIKTKSVPEKLKNQHYSLFSTIQDSVKVITRPKKDCFEIATAVNNIIISMDMVVELAA